MIRPLGPLTLIVLLVAAEHAFAQEAVTPGLQWRTPTGEFEVAIADKYIYNGYVIQDQGPIVQPYFELAEEFYRGDGLITSASATFSFFTSLQSREDGATHAAAPGRWFYETQTEAGIELELAKQLTVSLSYLHFDSPIDAYTPSNALQLSLTWDDKDIAGWFPLKPHVTWLAALPFGFDRNEGDGNYFEVGVAPTKSFASESAYPLTLTVPINVGFGDDRYYPGSSFGYVSIALAITTPLAFLPKDLGEWKFGVTGTYYHLGRAPADLSNDGDRNQGVFIATVSTEF